MDTEQVLELSIEVPATVQESWRALATGVGVGSWFLPCSLVGHEGGTVRYDLGEHGRLQARVVGWDPPRSLAVVELTSEGRDGARHEWLVQAHETEGSTIRLRSRVGPARVAHDGEVDELARALFDGWPVWAENLRAHLTHFPGLPARAITPTVMLPGGHEAAWESLCDALELQRDLGEGAHLTTSGDGVPMLAGTIERTVSIPGVASAYVVLADAPAAGTACIAAIGGGDRVACSVWLHLHDEDRDLVEDRWTPFMSTRWPRRAGTAADG